MNSSVRTSLIWGMLIGFANLAWLYLAYFLGLHTNGIIIFQVFMLIWLGISITGYVFAIRAMRRQSEQWSYLRGIGLGALAAVVSAVIAVIAQIGYFTVVHPAWPIVMEQQAKDYFESQGVSGSELAQKIEAARANFTLVNYAVQSAIAALMLGIVLSAIIMIFLRRQPKR